MDEPALHRVRHAVGVRQEESPRSDLRQLPVKPDAGCLDLSRFDVYHGKEQLPLNKFIDNFDAAFSYIANEGSEIFLHTNLEAPRYR